MVDGDDVRFIASANVSGGAICAGTGSSRSTMSRVQSTYTAPGM
jgi:hypothetical protein